jgi:uncharacterized phage protein gp47/JayE
MATNLLASQYTYEFILSDMLSRVPNTMDKREGSIIYDAIAPCAYKLAEAYFIMYAERDLYFLDTTEGEYLDRKGNEFGIKRKGATYALRKATFTDSNDALVDVPIGERFRINDLTFVTETKLSTGSCNVRCEQIGSVGNNYNGIMLPLGNDVPYVANALLLGIQIHGEDIESDLAYRERIRSSIVNAESDGNRAQYLKWASQFEGVGVTKIFPLANGNNTVKVSITNSNNQQASTELIKSFQDYLDPEKEGLGNGKAPIGAKVTVVTGTKKIINIKADVTLANGHSAAEGTEEAIKAYFSIITYKETRVSYIGLASTILQLDTVSDVRNLLINGVATDIPLADEDIPMLGTLDLVVS